MTSIFRGELATQCRLVLIGVENLQDALNGNKRFDRDPTAYTWGALQSILVSAANISKLLWGSGPGPKRAIIEARRQSLREELGVDDSSVLNSTRLRNDFEHFDERIEKWFGESSLHNYVGRNIGPPGMIVMAGEAPGSRFGHFDPENGIVEFWENAADIRAVADAADSLLARIHEVQGY